MGEHDWTAEIDALDEPRGAESRVLRAGEWRITIEGLDPELAGRLDRRWGSFVTAAGPAPTRVLRVFRAPAGRFLPGPAPGELYRMEPALARRGIAVASYHFALAPEADPAMWRCGVADQAIEPADRALENAVRYLVAREAVESGGFALHGAGVLRDGLAFVFAGPSRSGKSTAVALSAPAQSLGDDFAAVVPAGPSWMTMALPFDNREVAPAAAPAGLLPVAGVFRLFQAAEARVEPVQRLLATSSLLSCAAMAPAMPDLADALMANVARFVATGRFAHLHFRVSPDFWPLLEAR